MAKRIVIATHASLARGFVDAASLLAGCEGLYAVCAYTECKHPEREIERLLDSFDSRDTVVILTDIAGGSVNQIVSRLVQKRDTPIHVITGANLGSVIELATMPEERIDAESLRALVHGAQAGLMYMNDLFERLGRPCEEQELDFF